MYPVIGTCPICGENLTVTRLYCRACDSTVEGHFTLGRFYHLAPDHRTPWRWDLPGTALAMVTGALASVGLRLYVRFGGSSNVLIGSLGSVLVVMIWMYLVAIGLLVGAELNAVLAERAGVEQVPRRGLELPRLERLTRRWAELEGENPRRLE